MNEINFENIQIPKQNADEFIAETRGRLETQANNGGFEEKGQEERGKSKSELPKKYWKRSVWDDQARRILESIPQKVEDKDVEKVTQAIQETINRLTAEKETRKEFF